MKPQHLTRTVRSALTLAILGQLGLGEANAAGYYFSDVGTRGMARAGAFIAGADDLSAQYYNPAALTRLGRPQFYLNHSLVWQNVEFTRKDYDPDGNLVTTYDTVTNEAPAMNIPAFGVSHNFGLKNTVFALGLFPPFAPRMSYPAEGAQKYTMKDSLVIQFYVGPTVAHRFNLGKQKLSIGAGAYMTYLSAQQSLDLSICALSSDPTLDAQDCSEPQHPVNDIAINLEMKDPTRFTWNAGLLYEPIEALAIGMSVQPPLNVEGSGFLEGEFDDGHWMLPADENAEPGTQMGLLDESAKTVRDDDVTVLLTMPWILRWGVAVHPNEKWELEGAAVWQRWSMTEETRVTDVNLSLKTAENFKKLGLEDIVISDDVVLPADYVNAWSYRLGGHFRPIPALTLRGGLMYETSAIPTNTQSVSLVDGNKVAMGLGAGYQIKNRWAFDLGMNRTWILQREITGSEVARQEIAVNLAEALGDLENFNPTLGPGQTVGNGTFASQLLFVSAGLTFKFGKHVSDL